MADMNDLADLMKSVETSSKEQTNILKSILDSQKKEAERAEQRFKLSRADRDVEPQPAPSPGPTPPSPPGGSPASDNTLAGLLGGLTALFGKDILGRFSLLAVGAAGLATSIGVTIGVVKGQLTAIETIFKSFTTAIRGFFEIFTPNLVKTFDDFKTNVSSRFVNLADAFTALIDDLRIRVAFIRVSVAEVFDNFVSNIRSVFSSGPDSKFSRVIAVLRTSIDMLVEPFRVAITTIQELAGPTGSPSRIAGLFGSISGWLGEIGAKIGRIASVVGKIFAPIAIIMTAFDTIKGALAGYAEGGILGGLKGAIDGFFTSLVTVPLDLVKNLVAWVAGKFGFDETAEVLREFSFTDLFRQMTSSIFNAVSYAMDFVKELFTIDLEEMETISNLKDWLTEKLVNIGSYIKEKFNVFADYVATIPDRIALAAEEMWVNLREKVYIGFLELGEWIASIPKKIKAIIYSVMGSIGITNPITGTRYSIVSEEEVAAAQAEAQTRSDTTDSRIAAVREMAATDRARISAQLLSLENSGMTGSRPIVINAPNNSQTNVNTRGGTNSTVVNAFGSSRSDLDFLSLPSGAQ